MWKIGWLRVGVLRGQTMRAAGWDLTPIVGVLGVTRRRATIAETSAHAEGFQWATIQPLAVEATRAGQQQLVLTPNVTRLILCVIGLIGLSNVIRFLGARRRRH
jgi:hypothetical protein